MDCVDLYLMVSNGIARGDSVILLLAHAVSGLEEQEGGEGRGH